MSLPLCAVCGKNEVPRAEWPADPNDPKVCDPCLRGHAWQPTKTASTPEPVPVATPAAAAKSDDEDTADFD